MISGGEHSGWMGGLAVRDSWGLRRFNERGNHPEIRELGFRLDGEWDNAESPSLDKKMHAMNNRKGEFPADELIVGADTEGGDADPSHRTEGLLGLKLEEFYIRRIAMNTNQAMKCFHEVGESACGVLRGSSRRCLQFNPG